MPRSDGGCQHPQERIVIMAKTSDGAIERLIGLLSRLPGVGERTAERLAYHIGRLGGKEALALADAIRDVQRNVRQCSVCCLLSESDPCHICAAGGRDTARICVVEASRDAHAIEASGSYNGLYHVLGGRLAPLDGVEPEHLNLAQLGKRIKDTDVKEVILATNPDMEGDTTAAMIKDILAGTEGVSITRLARGLPSGSHLEYANPAILSEALDQRREL